MSAAGFIQPSVDDVDSRSYAAGTEVLYDGSVGDDVRHGRQRRRRRRDHSGGNEQPLKDPQPSR